MMANAHHNCNGASSTMLQLVGFPGVRVLHRVLLKTRADNVGTSKMKRIGLPISRKGSWELCRAGLRWRCSTAPYWTRLAVASCVLCGVC